MKKHKFIAVMAGLLLAVMFSGCGEASEDKQSGSKKESTSVESSQNAGTAKDDGDAQTGSSDAAASYKYQVGDYVFFGSYEQDNDQTNGKEPIKWQIMDMDGNNALLFSVLLLDNQRYNEPEGIYGDSSRHARAYASCDLKDWLNRDFVVAAFTQDEYGTIVDTFDAASGDDKGKVFVPSYEEIVRYYKAEVRTDVSYNGEEIERAYSDAMVAKATPYAKTQGLQQGDGVQTSAYWLRSSLSWDSWFTAEGHALYVEEEGRITLGIASLKNEKTLKHGVRPCVWVAMDQAQDMMSAATAAEEQWLVTAQAAADAEYECSWELQGGTLILRGNDKTPKDWEEDEVPWYESRDQITRVEIYGLKKIRDYLITDCKNLQTVVLDDTVERIYEDTFYKCNDSFVVIYKGENYSPEDIVDIL